MVGCYDGPEVTVTTEMVAGILYLEQSHPECRTREIGLSPLSVEAHAHYGLSHLIQLTRGNYNACLIMFH